jgi:hypothetical protein
MGETGGEASVEWLAGCGTRLTTGIFAVALFAASAAGVPLVTITSTFDAH